MTGVQHDTQRHQPEAELLVVGEREVERGANRARDADSKPTRRSTISDASRALKSKRNPLSTATSPIALARAIAIE